MTVFFRQSLFLNMTFTTLGYSIYLGLSAMTNQLYLHLLNIQEIITLKKLRETATKRQDDKIMGWQFDWKMLIKIMFRIAKYYYFSSVKAYNSSKNYYKILDVSENAEQNEIKKSFRALAKKYHPDSNKGKEDLFKEVNEAYQVLSDLSIKKDYDQERRLKGGSSQPGSQNGQYSRNYNQETYSNQQNANNRNYRGYQPEQGWKNRNFRDQFMHDIYRAQQGEHNRSFNQTQKARFQREFRERLRSAAQHDSRQSIRQYSQRIKQKQAQQRREYEEQMKRQKQKEYEQYRRYQDESFHDASDKLKQKANKIAEGIADNVKDFLSVTQDLKNLWNSFKKKK